ncbi:MAG: hypothetical protein KF716_03295 [Anaerolineae bacterium]|nr:hypothetical protein [Anaerolineae bacterium]
MSITLTAANNLLIEFDADRWTMQVNGSSEPAVHADATGLRYTSAFASARRLEPGGLAADQITMVVTGWSDEDRSWHVGLLLDPQYAATRGGRWCELARWTTLSGSEAESAGRQLATLLQRSFRLVAPEIVAPTPAPAEPNYDFSEESVEKPKHEVGLNPLPLQVGEWTVSALYNGMQWERTTRWRNDQLIRGVFFAVLTPIFALLSLGAWFSPYANVQPEWLPLLGLGLAGVMLLSALAAFWQILSSPTTTIDSRLRVIQQKRRSSNKMIQSPFEGLEYVLISHTLVRKQNADAERMIAAMEVWLHVYSPRRGFIQVCNSEHIEGYLKRNLKMESRRPLDLGEIDTPAHHAAAHVAQAIGIPVYYEER